MLILKSRITVLVMRSVLLFIVLLWIAGCIKPPKPESESFIYTDDSTCHGQDILGLARQNVQMISNNWDQGECLGVLAGTFGPSVKPVETIISQNIVPAVRWHLSFCNHGSNCQPGECAPTNLNCMKGKAKAINNLHTLYPQTKCYISPRLEYQESNCTKVKSWFTAVASVAPLCRLVASFMPGSCVPLNTLVEKHGNSPGNAAIVSNDGANYFDSNSVKYNKLGTVMNLKWTPRNNLRLSSEKSAPLPPLKRPISNRLGVQDLKQMQLMKHPLPPMPVPAFCKSFRPLRNGEIWKNHAEDYGTANDGRGNKPLFISNKKVNRWNIYNAAGTRIACVKYYGPYYDRYRLYVGSCSGDHAVDLYRKAGEWVFIKDGTTCIGVPSIRRWGSFR